MEQTGWHQLARERVLKKLETGTNGLTSDEVKKRQYEYGFNQLEERKGKSLFGMLLEQFKDILVIILIIAAVISGALGEVSDTIVIMIVVVLNAVLGVVQENKAEKSLAALKRLSSPTAIVKRNGRTFEVQARELVPGDIILLEAGKYVPADCRLIEASNLKVEESSLTGESVPVEKNVEPIYEQNIALGDKKNMVFMSSMVTYGRASAAVVSTGMNTEIGKIAEMIQHEEKSLTPLQIKLEELGKWLGIISVAVCAMMFFVGILNGKGYLEMFMTSVSLAVAAIPEGLPAVVTIVLAVGVQRMIKKNAIIRKLPAVETLGCADVICSDKTGTLTQNKMTVTRLYTDGVFIEPEENNTGVNMDMLFKIITLCNDTKLAVDDGEARTIGDPTETALVEAALRKGMDKNELDRKFERIEEIPFDSDRKLMTTINKFGGEYKALVKGAPDILLKRCSFILDGGAVRKLEDEDIEKIMIANQDMGKDALRVLSAAYRDFKYMPSQIDSASIENELIFVGLAGMIDPPREEVKEAVRVCRHAGIRPVMITGDHRITAMAIAKELGILDDNHEAISGVELDNIEQEELKQNIEKYSVYARVSPEHKVRIVDAWQSKGHVVAMTGDGVNDAPALKRADIGAAMGITGTDVAKGAADMVLTDDNFATIVSAVEEGRVIFSNIKKSIHFLLSCNIGEIVTLFVATLLGWEEPLIPIHILWVNLITDSLPALALGLDPPEKGIMGQKPRDPREGIFKGGLGVKIGLGGIIIGSLSLLAYNIGQKYGLMAAQTMTFAVMSMSQLAHSHNVRSETQSLFKIGFFSNKYLFGANICSIFLMLIVIFVPFLRNIFKLTMLNWDQWIIVIALSLAPIAIIEIIKSALRLSQKYR